jgi:hypothetical protein
VISDVSSGILKLEDDMKYLNIVVILTFVIYPNILQGQQLKPDSFKNYISYESGFNILYLDPLLANKSKIEKDSTDENAPVIIFPFKNGIMSVAFDPGLSEDPAFIVKYKKMKKDLGGETLYVSSSGFLYLVRHSNEYFQKRLKYIISDGIFKEIDQPFYLVNTPCIVSTPLQMYTEKDNSGSLVAKLPKESVVYVLLMDNSEYTCPPGLIPNNEIGDPVNNYLVSTSFGLVGWVVSTGGYLSRPGKPLGCLRFLGD